MFDLGGMPAPVGDPWHWQVFDDRWSLASLLRSSADRHAARRAFLSADAGWLTHGDLWRRAGIVRGALHTAGVPGSAVVACITEIGVPWVTAVVALMATGRTYVALEPGAPDALNARCLDESGADVVLAEARFKDQALRLAGPNRRVLVIGGDDAVGEESAGIADVSPEATAAIVFTSGSTGGPKGLIRSQRSLAHAAYSFGQVCGDSADLTVLYFGTASHVASLNTLLRCLIGGFGLIAEHFSAVDLDRVGTTLADRGVNVIVCGPALLRLVLDQVTGTPLPEMQLALVSGSALTGADAVRWHAAFPGIPIMQNYGSTETGPMAAGRYVTAPDPSTGVLPLQITHEDCVIELVDADGRLVPPGRTGRIRIRSKYLADGYLNRARESSGGFGSDSDGRFFLTGDLAVRGAAGELFVLARSDRQVKVHGRRVDLADVGGQDRLPGCRTGRRPGGRGSRDRPGRPPAGDR